MPIIPLVPVREIEKKGLSGEFIQFLELLRAVVLNLTSGSDFVFTNGSRAMVSDATGALAESSVTAAELAYLDGVTSAIQTQFAGKVSKTSIPVLTDNSGGTANDTVEDCGMAVTGVDGTGSNAASKADVDTRLTAIANNIADLAAKINAILAATNAV